MKLSEEEVKTRQELIWIAAQIAARNDAILKAIHSTGNEKIQLAMLRRLLSALEDFHKKNFICPKAN